MKTTTLSTFLAACFIVIWGCSVTANADTEIIQSLNLAYGTDHDKQKLDVFRPADNPDAPLVVLIHGGGWYRGVRDWTYQDAIYLAQNGYAVASLGYRTVLDYPNWNSTESGLLWDGMKSDLMHGLEYLVDNADTLGIDASKAITMGSSAGGHLSLAVKNRAATWVEEGIVDRAPEMVGAVAHCPAANLQALSNPYLTALKRGVSPEDIDPMQMDPSGFEGILVVHGNKDTNIPVSRSVSFYNHLSSNDSDVDLAILPGVNHGYIYELGLDKSLAPGGEWVLPTSRPLYPEHGQMGFDASMAYIAEQPGYDLPYTPFDANPEYNYFGTNTLLVGSRDTDKVLKYDVNTGMYLGAFATSSDGNYTVNGASIPIMNQPTDIQIGPDGNVYVAFRDGLTDSSTGGIACYSREGVYQGMFTDSTAYGTIMNFSFDSNGDIVAGYYENGLHHFKKIHGPDSDNAGTLAGDLDFAGIGLTCNPNDDGTYYFGKNANITWDDTDPTTPGVTNIFAGPLGDETSIYDLEFSPDGKLYAIACTEATDQSIYVCDNPDAENPTFSFFATYSDADPALAYAVGMAFDNEGNLLVANSRANAIAKFCVNPEGEYAYGDFMGNLIDNSAGAEGHLDGPFYGLAVLMDETDPIPGDANGDGKVDGSDVTILANNWQAGVNGEIEATWAMGDFNGDKKVDGSDVTILANNWQQGVTTAATAAVPEPSTIALLSSALAALLVWRRKK